MANKPARNWVAEFSNTVGTGDISFTGAIANTYATFAASFAAFDPVVYHIFDRVTGDQEAGLGTFTGTVLATRTPSATLINGVLNITDPAPISMSGDCIVYHSATAGYIESELTHLDTIKVNRAGDIMTGQLQFNTDPVSDDDYSRKGYVDVEVASRISRNGDTIENFLAWPDCATIYDGVTANRINHSDTVGSDGGFFSFVRTIVGMVKVNLPGTTAGIIHAVSGQSDRRLITLKQIVGQTADYVDGYDSNNNILFRIDNTGAYIQTSDERLKKDQKVYEVDLKDFTSVRAVTYKWKHSGSESIGFIAQELAPKFPYAVKTHDNGYLGVNLSGLIGILWSAVRKLILRLDQLESRLDMYDKFS